MTSGHVLRLRSVLAATLLSGMLAECGGSGGDDATLTPGTGTPPPTTPPPTTPPPTVSNLIEDAAMAQRFLSTATFGGTQAEIDALVGRDAAEWLAEQFNESSESYGDRIWANVTVEPDVFFSARLPSFYSNDHPSSLFWREAIGGNDQLRQRMLFALSQIIVVSENNFGRDRSHRFAYYMDNLYLNAFGNYRDILEDITYTPIMGDWLTYVNNRKADPATGRLPDENYAREILQLFSIGLLELNTDGTPRLQNGQTIDTYDNDDIVNLARVFTGLVYDRSAGGQGWLRPMIFNDRQHSEAEKRFLTTVIPENTSGPDSIRLAIDGIFAHPNVAPFISRQLIQRFTMSSPPPAYVERVATAFESGSYTAVNGREFGSGQRGDMRATIAAMLLDELMFAETVAGKIKEPVLRFAHAMRALEIQDVVPGNENDLRDTSNTLGQNPFRPASVFNFYRPGYVAPNTTSGAQDLTAPELQIVNSTSVIGFLNFMVDYVFDRTPNGGTGSFAVDYSRWSGIADDPTALVTALDNLFTGGRLPDEAFNDYVDIIDQMPLRAGQANDPIKRIQTAIVLVTTSTTFATVL
ncbi:MAG: DUF1800 family protein [Pseudomonadota bacterium]